MKFKKLILLILVASSFYHLSGFMTQALDANMQKRADDFTQQAYEVEVVITNVEVIVTDKDGNRITGLQPGNFEIYEDGVSRKLTNFYEVKGPQVFGSTWDEESGKLKEESLPLPEKARKIENRIILFFDNWHLHPRNRAWITNKLDPFIRNNFGRTKDNQGMVIFLDRSLEIVQDFTPDPLALLYALDSIKKRTGNVLSRMKAREDLSVELNRIAMESSSLDRFKQFQHSMDYARSFIEEEMNILSFVLKSLDSLIDYLSGIEGRKVLIYICDGLPLNPGEEVFTAIEQSYNVGNARAEAMNYDATDLYKKLTARCNSREISIYPINAQVLETGFDSADRDRSWTARSSGTSIFMSRPATKREALKMMARETGGDAVLSSGGINDGLKTIANDLDYFYSLGYKSPHRADGQYHSIDVKLVGVDKPYNLRIRKGYIKSSPSERLKENVLARLFIQNLENPLGIKVQDLPMEKLPFNKIKLSMKFLIPLDKIALLPQEKEHVGKIKVYVAFLDSKNHWSDPFELIQEIRIPHADYEEARRSFFPYVAELHLEPDSYVISVAVKDVVGLTTSYLQFKRDVSD